MAQPGGDPNTLYFSDGINGERDGLFAAVSAVPEPSTLVVLATSLMIGTCCLPCALPDAIGRHLFRSRWR